MLGRSDDFLGVEPTVAKCRYRKSNELSGGSRPPTPSTTAEAGRGRGMKLDEQDRGSLALRAADCDGPVLPRFEEKHTKGGLLPEQLLQRVAQLL